ncbi:MAG TPA: RDD family protein, partial [Candidatus Sulfotelmatobacter sp.]|nr:RDD family protein [Candidatus Sulfotelmatobacter sp.]
MAENVFCSKCGAQNSNTAQFCQKCGGAVWSAGTAVQPAPQQAPAYAPQPAVYVPVTSSPYAGFWIRFLAFIIDRIIMGIVAGPFWVVLVLPTVGRIIRETEQNQEPSPELIVSIVGAASTFLVLVFVAYWLYEALLTSSSWQGTIGKRVLRLKVTDEAGNRISFGRST